MGEERPVEPFSDLHVEEGHVRATLLHDPTVEGLDVAIYIDGSGSMNEEYAYRGAPRRTFWQWLLGKPASAPTQPPTNEVEPQVRWMLEYLATKDRNGMLRVAYWACGTTGTRGRGHRRAARARTSSATSSPARRQLGSYTYLAPAIQDYVAYLK